jgi:hypothetical protein
MDGIVNQNGGEFKLQALLKICRLPDL